MKIIIEDMQAQLKRATNSEDELKSELTKFKGMLSQQLERVIDFGDEKDGKGWGTPSKDLLAKSQGSLLRKLENEAGEMADMAGMAAVAEEKLEMKDLGGPPSNGPQDTGFAERIDPNILRTAESDSPAQAVIVMNQEGLGECFKLYSRNQHTGKGGVGAKKGGVGAKRKAAPGGATHPKNDTGGAANRVLGEDNFLRLCRDLGLGSVLPNGKLLGAYHVGAVSGEGEKRPVLDLKGFRKVMLVIGLLVFDGDEELTAREKVGMFLSSIDAENRFLNWSEPVLLGGAVEKVRACERRERKEKSSAALGSRTARAIAPTYPSAPPPSPPPQVLWHTFLKYVSVKDKQQGPEHGSLTSQAYAKFAKDGGVLRGLPFAMGKTDTVFREVVMKRAHRIVKGVTGKGRVVGGTHGTNTSR